MPLTLDIFNDLSISSLIEIEKLFTCWPIWMLSPTLGAKISFVIDLMLPELSMSACVAGSDACTMI